jgi:hypothetical protein
VPFNLTDDTTNKLAQFNAKHRPVSSANHPTNGYSDRGSFYSANFKAKSVPKRGTVHATFYPTVGTTYWGSNSIRSKADIASNTATDIRTNVFGESALDNAAE